VRAPQRLFSEQAAADVDEDVEHDDYEGVFKFDKKTFDATGFLVMKTRITAVDTVDIRPTLAELRIFEDAAGAVQENDDSATTRNPFKKGDKVEVKEGELQYVDPLTPLVCAWAWNRLTLFSICHQT
jgi:transcription elongation factor